MPPRQQPRSPGSGGPIPPILESVHILPRQPGETLYQYRYRRTVSLYGQTPYQRRIYLAAQRGIGTTAGRGHAPSGGETESQRRNRISLELFGQTSSQRYRAGLREWLDEHGYTPELTGMTQTDLMRLGARLRYMYNAAGEGGRVYPQMIYDAVQLEHENALPAGWAFQRLWEKYDAMVAYREYRDKDPGRAAWVQYQQVKPYIPSGLSANWWYYH